jgi:hypothetical protein
VAPVDDDDREPHSTDNGQTNRSLGGAIQSLLRAGHTRNDILDHKQPGLPYPGWSLPQLVYWTSLAIKEKSKEALSLTSLTALAVGGSMSKEGNAALQRELSRLSHLSQKNDG